MAFLDICFEMFNGLFTAKLSIFVESGLLLLQVMSCDRSRLRWTCFTYSTFGFGFKSGSNSLHIWPLFRYTKLKEPKPK